MRQIKFRTWLKNYQRYQRMVDVQAIDFYNGTVSYIEDDYVNLEQSWEDEVLDNVVLMQSTGLFDKKGVEIYEGDILKIQTSDFYSKKITDEYIGQICFSRGGFFVLTDGHHTDFCLWGKSMATMEVIGNIHDNPELMEVEK